jgi:tellurite methyltransferase
VADWNERYRKGEHSPAAPHQLLTKAVDSVLPGKALDLACGAGRNAVYLASRGWHVTGVDSSPVGLEIVRQRATELGVNVETIEADLEQHEFAIEVAGYDLICIFYYLQRDLFTGVKAGLRSKGTFAGAIHIVDEDPDAHPMNPAFLLEPGELKEIFAGWEIDYYREGRWEGADHKHRDAEIIARKP